MSMILEMENEDLNAAVLRIIPKINMSAIEQLISDIPEKAYGKTVITNNQKQLYIQALNYAYENVLAPAYSKLKAIKQ